MITILSPHQEQQNRQSTKKHDLCCFQLSQTQETVSLGMGPPHEAARPRRCGCGWKNRTLPCCGVFQHSLFFFYTSIDLVLLLHASVGKHTEKTLALNL